MLKLWLVAILIVDAVSLFVVIALGSSSEYEIKIYSAYAGLLLALVQIGICITAAVLLGRSGAMAWMVVFLVHILLSIAFALSAELGVFAR